MEGTEEAYVDQLLENILDSIQFEQYPSKHFPTLNFFNNHSTNLIAAKFGKKANNPRNPLQITFSGWWLIID